MSTLPSHDGSTVGAAVGASVGAVVASVASAVAVGAVVASVASAVAVGAVVASVASAVAVGAVVASVASAVAVGAVVATVESPAFSASNIVILLSKTSNKLSFEFTGAAKLVNAEVIIDTAIANDNIFFLLLMCFLPLFLIFTRQTIA